MCSINDETFLSLQLVLGRTASQGEAEYSETDPTCHHFPYHLSCNPAVRKTIDSAGKITILGSGKATTRAKDSITSRVEGTGPSHRFPTRHSEEPVPLP